MSEKTAIQTYDIVEKIWLSIAERRLRPGTQLKEEQLSAIFNVSRAKIRQALSLLEREGLVSIIPHRGAFVSQPTTQEARDVFFIRRSVENCIIERLCGNLTQENIARLQNHVLQERHANEHDATTDIIKLSGGFHLLLAELTGSDFLFTTMRDLISRSSLITAVYRNTAKFNCGPDEHDDIVLALIKNDKVKAISLMDHHLDHVESALDLSDMRDQAYDLQSALS